MSIAPISTAYSRIQQPSPTQVRFSQAKAQRPQCQRSSYYKMPRTSFIPGIFKSPLEFSASQNFSSPQPALPSDPYWFCPEEDSESE